jgi:hypothetical protein
MNCHVERGHYPKGKLLGRIATCPSIENLNAVEAVTLSADRRDANIPNCLYITSCRLSYHEREFSIDAQPDVATQSPSKQIIELTITQAMIELTGGVIGPLGISVSTFWLLNLSQGSFRPPSPPERTPNAGQNAGLACKRLLTAFSATPCLEAPFDAACSLPGLSLTVA